MTQMSRRKPRFPLRLFLFLTSMLVAPSVAAAQETQPAPEPTPGADASVAAAQVEPDDAVASEDDNEIVIRGRFIPEPMRQTSEVATFLSSEDLDRQGDSNAAAALTRLTGLTIASGGFVVVRGLNERYSSALLNGSPLPSPEPLRRTVPLDLFPANILQSASVQKTFSPNYPGEFGGGVIDLKTLRQPNEPFLNLKIGTGGNTETTLERGLVYYGESSDWTGLSDGLRDIPGPLAAAIARGARIQDSNFTGAELETIGESLVNSPLTVIQSEKIDPNASFEATAGTSIDIGKYSLGLVGVVGYDNGWRTRDAIRQGVSGGSLETDFENTTTTWDITTNALGSLSLGWDDNEISFTGLLIRNTTKEAQINTGFDTNVDPSGVTTVRSEGTSWYERQLFAAQLNGEHKFGALDLNWRGSFAQSTREAPYERGVTYDVVGGVARYSRLNQNSTRFSDLTDEIVSGGVDVGYTINLDERREIKLTSGIAYQNNVRQYELISLTFGGPAVPAGDDVLTSRVDFLFSPNNIDPLRFELIELTGADDRYKAGLLVNAAYAAADVEFTSFLRGAFGVRYEDGSQFVRTSNRFGEPSAAPVSIQNQYYLPAATLTWNFADDLQLRVGYSQTITRPQFRELAFSLYTDPETDREYRGNPALVDSEISNLDARLEYYFGRQQFVTFGGFYKDIESPIEEVIIPTTGSGETTRFINAPKAVLYGAEAEYRTTFEMPFDIPFLTGASWLFSANYTYTFSEVQAEPGDLVIDPSDGIAKPASGFGLDGSQLQGTSENSANIQFGYDTGTSQLTLLVGWVDERIARRGLGSLPNVIEYPGVNLDLVYRRDIKLGGTDFTLGVSGRNLLGEDHEEYQNSSLGRTEVNTYDLGQSFSVSLTAKF
jgi:outer membrane receptor protein involved in Fe transport